MEKISINLSSQLKPKPDQTQLGFGKIFTDHMFVMDYTEGKGWHDPRIVPYGPIELEPSAMVLHYAQEAFEGLKAYRTKNGDIQLFRPWENIARMNRTGERLCIPEIDPEMFLEALKTLIRIEADWIPSLPGTSLYIRPFVIATDPFLGVHPSHTYKFFIILSPVGAYYAEGLAPVKIYVETEDVRAVRGGTGYAKAGGNYAASIRAQKRAGERGYTQVLWLDGVERKYIEEVGAMNVLFKIDGKVVTPSLSGGSILPGITRKSCIEMLRSWGIEVEERQLSAQELFEAGENGKLEEAFGSGTAAVVSPIGWMEWDGRKIVVNNGEIGEITQRLYDELTGIQWGDKPDPFGWTMKI